MTLLQQAAKELMDAMVQTDFTCRLGEQLDALEKALEAEQAQTSKSRTESLYEELRKATDDGSESMTHDDALKQIAYWRDNDQAQAAEATITTKTEQIAGAISKHISTPLIQREVIEAAQYIARRYMRPAPPAKQAAASMSVEDVFIASKEFKSIYSLVPHQEVIAYTRAIEARCGVK